LAMDGSGNLYVADTYNFTIRKLTPSGTNWAVSTLAGQPGVSGTNDDTGSAARFHYPADLIVDSGGNVFVADSYNETVRKITPAGVVTTIAGYSDHLGAADGTNISAQFYLPHSLTLDNNGTLYVADAYNDTIRRVTQSGSDWIVTTIAGSAGLAGNNDGTR